MKFIWEPTEVNSYSGSVQQLNPRHERNSGACMFFNIANMNASELFPTMTVYFGSQQASYDHLIQCYRVVSS